MIDFVYRFSRRIMPASIYQTIRGSYLGRQRKWENISTYREIFSKYNTMLRETGNDFTNKTALEIGCGDQIYTALFLLASGCQKVILAEPKLQIFNNKDRVRHSVSIFKKAMPEFLLSDDEITARLFWLNDIRDIPDSFNNKVDIILTHLVLEHFDNLDLFFSAVHKFLVPNGISLNMVDLSDHIYHIFTRFKILAPLCRSNCLNHLRYSNKTFALLNDPKCFMNRYLLPMYCQKAAAHNLDCQISQKLLFDKKVRINSDVVNGLDIINEDDLKAIGFTMLLRKY